MKNKKLKYIQNNAMEVVLALLLIVQLCLVAYSNLTMIAQNLDCDNAKLLKHIITMWEQKTLVIPGWAYTTTLEWDCTTMFALPLYGLTKNIYLSSALSNILFAVLMVAVLFFLFTGKEKLYPLLSANLIFIPYGVGMLDYYNMLFFAGAQYIVKVILPLILIGLLLAAERKAEGIKDRRVPVFTVLYFVLLLVSSMSSSIYVVACGIFPVYVIYVCWKFFRWEKVTRGVIILGGGTGLCVIVGMKVNSMFMGGTRAESMVFTSVYQALGNISSCFFGIFELMGGSVKELDVPVFSVRGIGVFGRLSLVVILLLCGIVALRQCLKKQCDLLVTLLISIFLWNYFILNVANVRAGSATYEYRYHLIGMLPLICVGVIVVLQGLRQNSLQQQRILFAGGFMALLLLNVLCYKDLLARGEQNGDLKEFCQYFEESDVDVIYMYFGISDSEICRLLDGEHLYLHLSDDGHTWVYDYYSRYVDATMSTENVIIAVDDSKNNMGESFSIQGLTLIKFDSVGGRSLYYIDDGN